jgi:hypothetical protein
VLIAISMSKLPRNNVFRTLDDTPVVTPANSSLGIKFAKSYKKICKFVNIGLAPNDPKKEKAFENSTSGIILGIQFNTQNLSWSLPKTKEIELQNLIYLTHNAPATHLKNLQQLLGKWEAISQMCPFAKGFRWPILNFMKQFAGEEELVLVIPTNVKDDMKIWAAMASAAGKGLPIAPPPTPPPVMHISFTSDAAGRRPPGSDDNTGVASLGTNNSKSWFGQRIFWKPQFTWAVQNNSAVYEMVGLLLPIVTLHKKLQYQEIVLYVDNEAIVWSWPKRRMKNDALASILLRALHIMEAYIPCKIYVEHLTRRSNKAAKITDNLSRTSTTSSSDLLHLTHGEDDLPPSFRKWLSNPTENWNLAINIINDIETRTNKHNT